VFGAPLRPVLVGNKTGSPSRPVPPSTLIGPQAPPGP
jgi:hypothetical protein